MEKTQITRALRYEFEKRRLARRSRVERYSRILADEFDRLRYAKFVESEHPRDEDGKFIGWHGTHTTFDKFDIKMNRLSPRGSSGAMGIFFATDKISAGHYGPRVIKAKLNMTNIATIDEEQYRQATNSRSDAANLRDSLIEQGHDGAYVPHLQEYIVFNPDLIEAIS